MSHLKAAADCFLRIKILIILSLIKFQSPSLSLISVVFIQIPTTRPRSPKLGRKKNPSEVDTKGNGVEIHQPGRLSLDEKVILVSRNKLSKGPTEVQAKRPQRKSLPKLPSQKTNLIQTTGEAISSLAPVQDDMTNDSRPIARVDEEFLCFKLDQVQPETENGSPVVGQGDHELEQEGVALQC